MVVRRPLVLISGKETELPPGDTLLGVSVGVLTASSGLAGGGDLSANLNIQAGINTNPSGVILVDEKLSLDGVALRTGQTALASGNYALNLDSQALASGVVANTIANTAQASGNAALQGIAAIPNGVIRRYSTASAVVSGYPVGLRLDGSVQTIGVVEDYNSRSYGSGFRQGTHAGDAYTSVSLSGTNNVFVALRGVGNYGYATVVTLNNLGATYGSAVQFSPNVNTTSISVAQNPASGQCLIVYRDNTTGSGVGVLAGVSGTNINLGTRRDFAGTATYNEVAYFPTVDKYLITYSNSSNIYGYGVVATASGSGLVYGTPSVFRSNTVYYPDITYDPSSDRAVLAFSDGAAGSFGSALVASISGTTPVYHSITVFQSSVNYYNSITTDESESAQYISCLNGNTSANAAIKGKVVSNVFTAGVPIDFDPQLSSIAINDIAYDKSSDRAVVVYGNASVSRAVPLASSGTVLYAGTPTTFFTGASPTAVSCAYNTNQKRVLINYLDTQLTSTVSAVGYQYVPTISGLVPYLGVAQGNAPSGSVVNVRLPGSYDTNFANLVPGRYYYLNPQASGVTISGTQPTNFSGVAAWAPIGQAMNASTLLLTQYQ